MLDEFKFLSYKARIESLKGTKKPLIDLLKELTELYGRNFYSDDSLQQTNNLYYILLTNLCKSHSSAANSTTKEIDKCIQNNKRYCYLGLNKETIKYADILVSQHDYEWYPRNMTELINLNNVLSDIEYTPKIKVDCSLIDKLSSTIPYYGSNKRKTIYQYIANKLEADAPILQYIDKPEQIYDDPFDQQIYIDLAKVITQLKETK